MNKTEYITFQINDSYNCAVMPCIIRPRGRGKFLTVGCRDFTRNQAEAILAWLDGDRKLVLPIDYVDHGGIRATDLKKAGVRVDVFYSSTCYRHPAFHDYPAFVYVFPLVEARYLARHLEKALARATKPRLGARRNISKYVLN